MESGLGGGHVCAFALLGLPALEVEETLDPVKYLIST